MTKKPVREWLPAHPTLLPPDIRHWLPDDHLVWFILDIIERIDLRPIDARLDARDHRGTVPYDPRMMVALLVYAYAVGVFSSRRIERATYEDVAFRVLTADQHPDHDTIATFRRENLGDFQHVFVQILRIAGQMGLVRFGVLGLDGVKILANASKHQAMSYDRMKSELARLEEEIARLVAMAEQTDSEERARFGDGRLMDLPEELRRRQERKAKIEAAVNNIAVHSICTSWADASRPSHRERSKRRVKAALGLWMPVGDAGGVAPIDVGGPRRRVSSHSAGGVRTPMLRMWFSA